MNNDYIYSIFDKLSARYGSPFAACNDMVAARLAIMIKGGFNPAFDCLYRIGIFSNASGAIESCEPSDISNSVSEVLEILKAGKVQEGEKNVE